MLSAQKLMQVCNTYHRDLSSIASYAKSFHDVSRSRVHLIPITKCFILLGAVKEYDRLTSLRVQQEKLGSLLRRHRMSDIG